jgi:hypothetical protein
MSVESKIDGLLTEHEEARRLSIGIRTLRQWRQRRYGPRPTKIGRYYYYTDESHQAFIANPDRPIEPARPALRRRA